MKKLLVIAATAVVACISYGETVAKVLAARAFTVDLYDVSDQGEWTFAKTFCRPASGYQAYGSICHEGIVYVAEGTGVDVNDGKVRRFNLNGTELAPLPDCPFRPHNFAVSPNGQYLFVACGAGGSATGVGNLYRYDLTQGTTGEWVIFASSGSGCMRAVDIDKNGDVFWASRGSILYAGNCYATDLPHGTLAYYTSGFLCGLRCANDGYIYFSSSKGDNFIGGKILWDSETKKFGAATTASTVDGSTAGWSDDLILIDGKTYFSVMNVDPGIVFTDLEAKTFVQVVSGATYSLEFFKVSTAGALSFEEGAYAAECTASPVQATLWPQGGAIAGAANGISGNCLYFANDKSTAKFVDSKTLLPQTGDFAFSFWFGLPAGDAERLLFSNRNSLFADEFSVLVDANGELGLKFASTASYTLASGVKVDDGAWHQAAVVRRGTSLELYCDGALVGSATTDAAKDKISRTRGFHLGCNDFEDEGFLGAGAFIDEFGFYSNTLLPAAFDLAADYAAHAGADVPTAAPAAPENVPALAAEAGVQVAHAFAAEGSFGSPTMAVLDGVYYIGVSVGEAAHAGCQCLRVYQSTDKGATWAAHSTLVASGASLFVSGGTLCAIGMPNDSTLTAAQNAKTMRAWTYGDGEWKQAHETSLGDYRFDMMTSQAPIASATVWKSVVCRVASGDYLMFNAHALGIEIDGTTFGKTYGSNSSPICFGTFRAYDTCDDVWGGVSVERLGMSVGGIHHFYPMVDRCIPWHPKATLCMERCFQQRQAWGGGTADGTVDMFRGGSRPFGIFYDATAKQYYAVTVPVTSSADLKAVNSQLEISDKLAVYVSKDLRTWYAAGTVSTLADASVGYNGAACVQDGDDILVATVVASDDGVAGYTKLRSNYLSFRRVSNFRTAHVAKAPASKERLYIGDREYRAQMYSYYRGQDGEWFPAGAPFQNQAFTASDGTAYTMGTVQNIIRRGNRLYACSCEAGENIRPARVYEMSLKGKLRRAFLAPTTAFTVLNFDVSADRTYAVVAVTGGDEPGVYKVVFADNSWTRIIANNDGHNGAARSVQVASNGDVYVGVWNSTLIHRYTTNGETYTWANQINQSQHTASDGYSPGLLLDEANNKLYSSTLRGKIYVTDLANNYDTTLLCDGSITDYHTAANILAIDPVKNRLYSTGRGGINRAYDLATGEMSCPFATLGSTTAICYIEDVDFIGDQGLLLFLQ